MKSCTKLTKNDRFRIEALWNSNEYSMADIANDIGKSRSCVSREIRRNSYLEGKYEASHAHLLAEKRYDTGRKRVKKLTQDPDLLSTVIKLLKKTLSPEQICSRKSKGKVIELCHETIYQYIYTEKKELSAYLRRRKNKFRRKHGTRKRCIDRENLKKRRIDTRPKSVDLRRRLGDFEGDTVVGVKGSGSILTLVDRKSGYAKAEKLKNEEKETITKAMVRTLSKVGPNKRKTITLDNGAGFWDFELVDKALGTTTYFAYPYHSWERGCNENFNGLLREFFPKKSSFATVTQKDVERAVELLNHRPRKRLGYLTPHEVFVLGMKPKK
jgi:transposase, IS30 family